MTQPDPPFTQPAPSGTAADDFESRLRAARERHRLERPAAAPAQTDQGFSALGIGFRVGAELLAALLVAVAIGWALDRALGTRPVFLALFVLLGGAAGVLNVWRMVGRRTDQPR